MKAQRGPTETASRPAGQLRLHSAVLRDTREFASLKEEWDELYNSCPSATPFSSWEWLYSWWEVYREDSYKQGLVTLRDPTSGLQVGLLPMVASRGRHFVLGASAIII